MLTSEGGAPSHRTAVALALLVTFLWSTSWVLIRWGLEGEHVPPITFAGLRYALGAAVLVGWLLARERPAVLALALDRDQLARLLALGVLFVAVAQGAQYVALAHQPAATTSLVLSLTPLFVAVTAAVLLAEVPNARQMLGVLLVAGGAILFFAGELGATAMGLLAALIGLAATVAGGVLGRAVNRGARISPALVTTVSMSAGAALLLVVGLLSEGLPDLNLRAWLIIGWLALVNTAFAFTLWNRSLQRLSAVASASINNTMLIQVALLAWLFLGEDPGAAGLAGIIVVSVGVLLAQRREPTTPDGPGGDAARG
jgi:drug/metabolite transporter (DMT)-like permease